MNQLSWLLYWGNVAGNLGSFLVFAGILIVAIAVVFVIFGVSLLSDSSGKEGKSCIVAGSIVAFLALVSWSGAVFCPSQETVYAIAASQMGEQALKSPIASKATQALTAWLDKQIAEDKSQ